MPRITFVKSTGQRINIDAKLGDSVMRAALDNSIEGIVAECGGSLSCATCHAYIAEDWADRIPPASEDEKVMVECAVGMQANSRLTCQITVTDDLDGLVVEIPASQF